MGEVEKPDITNIVFGTVNDFDSIETPLSMTLEFVPKEHFDKLQNTYNELTNSFEELKKEKEFFKERANDFAQELGDVRDTLREYEATIKTLAKLINK